jgi:hypothetical protein
MLNTKVKRKYVGLVMRLILSFLLAVSAQALLGLEIKAQSQAASCPSLNITCPANIVWPGTPTDISLNISDGNTPTNLKYKWQLSVGQIISGQGTSKITVDTTDLDLGGKPVTVTVEVDGMFTECAKTVSCNFTVIGCRLPPRSMKFDEYDDLSWIKEGARLDNLAIQLQQMGNSSKGYVIIYGPSLIDQHLARVWNYLVKKRGIDKDRIV